MGAFESAAPTPSQQANPASGDRQARVAPEPMCREALIKKVKGRRKRDRNGRRSSSLRDTENGQGVGWNSKYGYQEDEAFNMLRLDNDMVFGDLAAEPRPGIAIDVPPERLEPSSILDCWCASACDCT